MINIKQYQVIRENLAEHEKKLNLILTVMYAFFSFANGLYAVRFYLNGYYTPKDGLYYWQGAVEIGAAVLFGVCAVWGCLLEKKHPKAPRILFAATVLIKAIVSTLMIESSNVLEYLLPVVFATGYFDLLYSVITSVSTLVSFLAADILAARYGILNISFLTAEKIEGMTYTFTYEGYISDRFVYGTIPQLILLFCICAICVLLSKVGADLLLRETKTNREKAVMDRELALGNEIQQSMLPDRIFYSDHFCAFSYMVSAKNVGGDFYDYFPIDDGRVLFTIGDVSGKGISASLFSSNTKALIRAFAMNGHSPHEILRQTNAALCATNKKKMFVTVWLGVLDLATGEVSCCNAGHNPPIVKKKDGSTEFLRIQPDFIVGRRVNTLYSMHSFKLEPGDTVILYTDGVTEAMNEAGDLYGEDRLLHFVAENPVDDRFTKELRSHIFAFKGDREQSDDISISCISYTKRKQEKEPARYYKATEEQFLLLRRFVMDFAQRHTEDRKTLNDIELCLGEVFSNIQFYSGKDRESVTDVSVEVSFENNALHISFADNGIPFDPLQSKDPCLAENRKNRVVGGFGIFMVKKLMDDVTYRYEDKNILTLTKKIQEA